VQKWRFLFCTLQVEHGQEEEQEEEEHEHEQDKNLPETHAMM
jgi:hypothetical protein